MKNFLQALDTTAKTVEILLKTRVISENGFPEVEIKYNQQVMHSGILQENKNFTFLEGIDSLMNFEIELKNKNYNRKLETAFIMDYISVDGFDIIPNYVHLINYDNDHDQNIKTNYLGYNGVWSLKINDPFYIWYHKISGQGMLIRP
jgi:hypothetical protein